MHGNAEILCILGGLKTEIKIDHENSELYTFANERRVLIRLNATELICHWVINDLQ